MKSLQRTYQRTSTSEKTMTEQLLPIEQLQDEIILQSLLYLPKNEIVFFSYSNRHYYQLVHENDYLWRELCKLFYHVKQTKDIEELDNSNQSEIYELKLFENVSSWKGQYKELVSYHFDVECAVGSRELVYSNHNRSVMNPKTETASYWASSRCTSLLKPGNKYQWSFTLSEYNRASHNTYWILLGIETASFPFKNQSGDDVLGYASVHNGCCLVVGSCTSIHKGDRINPTNTDIELKQGDCIGVVLDMSKDSDSAVIEFYHILDQQATLILSRQIPKNEYYPAVSMNQEMKVTIGSWPVNCKLV
jgi:hypothetical protein